MRSLRPLVPFAMIAAMLYLVLCCAGCKHNLDDLFADTPDAGAAPHSDGSGGTGPQGPIDAGSGGSNSPTMMAGGSGGNDNSNCVRRPETCNALDDDCDNHTDEETLAYCQSIVVHADTKCVPIATQDMPAAACVQLGCLEGFDDCDGKPGNGCEKPFCACNDCGDAGQD